ncbi:GTP diphosphokinase, partial [Xanthomonas sp. Kuri4-2]
MTRSPLPVLDTLLQRPAASAVAPELREALLAAWSELPEAAAPATLWPLLADTLDALALLSADEPTLIAAVLFDLPALRAALPALARENAARRQAVE